MKKTLTALALASATFAAPAQANGSITLTGDDILRAIQTFDEEVLADPAGGGQDIDLIRQALVPDWQTRPNPLKQGARGGQDPEGMLQLMSGRSAFMVDPKIKHIRTMRPGNDTILQGLLGATINRDPRDRISEIPVLPGSPVEDINGRSFVSMAPDIQVLNEDGLIYRARHMEDWSSARALLLVGLPSDAFSPMEN